MRERVEKSAQILGGSYCASRSFAEAREGGGGGGEKVRKNLPSPRSTQRCRGGRGGTVSTKKRNEGIREPSGFDLSLKKREGEKVMFQESSFLLEGGHRLRGGQGEEI